MKFRTLASGLALSAAVTATLPALPAQAASHREAPMIAMDPSADITDVYAFVSYDEENLARAPADRRITFILNVIPGQDPGDGPNYFNFSDEVLYRIHIDNDQDGVAEDIVYEFRFDTESRPVFGTRDTPLAYVGNPALAAAGLALEGAISLAELGARPSPQVLQEALLAGLGTALGAVFEPSRLTSVERHQAADRGHEPAGETARFPRGGSQGCLQQADT